MNSASANRIVIDLDGTLTIDDPSRPYADRLPRGDVVARLREYKAMGWTICIQTARNMRTFAGNVGQINVHTLPIIQEWLARHDVPCDELIVGKPWCGPEGFYVDDRAIRPDEFVELSSEAIRALIGGEPTN